MKIIKFEGGQGSKSWLLWRSKRICATDSGIILGLNHFKGIHDLWMEKMGFIEPKPASEAMKRGSLLENEAREMLCAQSGVDFEPIVIESSEYPWMGASLDGISQDHSCLCEIKCMKLQKHLQVSKDTIDLCHYAQMQHQLACSGAQIVYYASYHPDAHDQLTIVEILPNDEYIAKMIEKEREFYFETMCNMEPTEESWTYKPKVR